MASPDAICRVHVVRTVVFYMECSVINMVFPHIITSNMCLPVTNALCLVHPTVPLLGFGTTASHSETTRAYNNYEYKIYQNITSIDCKWNGAFAAASTATVALKPCIRMWYQALHWKNPPTYR